MRKLGPLALLALLTLLGCSGGSPLEAPMLRERVQAGLLPPLKARLPENPYVQAVHEEIGYFGGTIRGVWKGRTDRFAIGKMTEEYLLMLTPNADGVEPNLVADFQVEDNGRTFAFTLRSGLKWSDGMPFTTADIMFFWEHIVQDKRVFGIDFPFWLRSPLSGNKPRIAAQDDLRFSITFDDPYAVFPYVLAIEGKDFFAPAHYYETWLPALAGEEAAAERAREKGYSSVDDMLLWEYRSWWIFPGIPSLRPWVVVNHPDEKHVILERNPYYWKVDPQGQQLPYIDTLDFALTKDNNVIRILAQVGGIDFQQRHMPGLSILEPYTEESDYRLVEFVNPGSPINPIQFNLTVKDPILRDLFNDVRFRRALSLALDREAVLKTQPATANAEIAQYGPGKTDPYYSARLAQSHIAYDPAEANSLLDSLGTIPFDAALGVRRRPDGQPLKVFLDTTANPNTFTRLVVENWQAVGIQVEQRVHSADGFAQRIASNDLQVGIQSISTDRFVQQPSFLVPTHVKHVWTGLMPTWLNDPDLRSQIDPAYLQLLELWGRLSSEPDPEGQRSLAADILDIYAENLWVLGTVTTYTKAYAVVNKSMKNVPEGLSNTDALRTPMNAKPQQFFYAPDTAP